MWPEGRGGVMGPADAEGSIVGNTTCGSVAAQLRAGCGAGDGDCAAGAS